MVTEEGDTVLMLVMNPVTVFPPLKFKNKKQEQFYWRTVRDVKKTLPYAKLICATLLETYEYIETFPTQKEREEYLKRMERRCLNSINLFKTIYPQSGASFGQAYPTGDQSKRL